MYEGSLCLCCMSTESLVQLFGPEAENGRLENYAKMLALCLRIPLSENDGHDFICTICVDKLKHCMCFKKQALKSISILSSVDLTELLPAEELQILGLTEPENITKLEHHNNTDNIASYYDNIATEEITSKEQTRKKVKKKVIELKMSPHSIQDNTDTQKVQNGSPAKRATQQRSSLPRVKRSVGRPRAHSPAPALPYCLRPGELACRECQRQFPNHITLKVHYNTHFGRHLCARADCHKRFMTRASLRKHAATHQVGPFRCGTCHQEFSKLNTLLSHKRLKHGATPPYRCGECGARFHTATRRRRHLAAAHAHIERRYVCQYCDKKFLDSGSRAKHVSCVHKAVYVQCARCGASVRRTALTLHMRRHDGLVPPKPKDKERRFSCKLCGAAFSQKHTLQYHIGSHVRRGQYAGDAAALIADTRRSNAKCGLLSDLEEATDEQYLDECAFSDDPPSPSASPDVSDASDDERQLLDASDKELQVPDANDNKRPAPDPNDNKRPAPDASDDILPGDVEALENEHDLYTYLDFSILSDFDE